MDRGFLLVKMFLLLCWICRIIRRDRDGVFRMQCVIDRFRREITLPRGTKFLTKKHDPLIFEPNKAGTIRALFRNAPLLFRTAYGRKEVNVLFDLAIKRVSALP